METWIEIDGLLSLRNFTSLPNMFEEMEQIVQLGVMKNWIVDNLLPGREHAIFLELLAARETNLKVQDMVRGQIEH